MLRRWVTVTWVVMVVGCGGDDGGVDPRPGTGTVAVTDNSSDSSLSATSISGASSARVQDGTTVITVGDVTSPNGGFTIVLSGAPAVASYATASIFPPGVGGSYLELWESSSADEFWHSTGGTVQITSVTGGTIELTVTGVMMAPTPTLGGTGTFTVNGSVTAVLEQ